MRTVIITNGLVWGLLLSTGSMSFSQPLENGSQQATATNAFPASLDIDKAKVEIEKHYVHAHPEVREYVIWTATTFGRSGLWLNEDAFSALPQLDRETLGSSAAD
jgi:hypothetical protein